MSLRPSSAQDFTSLLSKYDTWMFDCDGVLWRGDRLIDGAVQVLDMLRRASECVDRYRNPRNGSLKDIEQKKRCCS